MKGGDIMKKFVCTKECFRFFPALSIDTLFKVHDVIYAEENLDPGCFEERKMGDLDDRYIKEGKRHVEAHQYGR
jgi:hypothetical protein